MFTRFARQFTQRPFSTCRMFQFGTLTLLGAGFGAHQFSLCETKDLNRMAYRTLGNSGLEVSVLGFGFWATYGSKDGLHKQDGIDVAKQCLRAARDAGINFFDNAETYGKPPGEAERIMGEAIRQLQEEDPALWRRSDIVVTTKLFWGGPGVNERGLSRKHIKEGMAASLKNLQMDYVDVVFCHRPDPSTPTEQVVRNMTELVRSGQAHAWGTSEWSAQQITEAVWMARAYGLEPPCVEQPQYNMFHRERFETEYAPLYQHPYNIGTTIWSPLASGLLTGKYNDSVPEGSRLASSGYSWLQSQLEKWREDGKIDTVRSLSRYAQDELKCNVTQLALAWCVKNPNVSTVLLGATKPSQVEENILALGVARRMTTEQYQEVNKILGNTPDFYKGYGSIALAKQIGRHAERI